MDDKRTRRKEPRQWCSAACRKQHGKRTTSMAALCSGTIGAVGELLAAEQLMRQGWHAYRCLSPNGPFDLIAFKDGVTRRLEVRTGRYYESGVATYPNDCNDYVTEFAVWVPDADCVEFIPRRRKKVCDQELAQMASDRRVTEELNLIASEARVSAISDGQLSEMERRDVVVKWQAEQIRRHMREVKSLEDQIKLLKAKARVSVRGTRRNTLSPKHKAIIADRKAKTDAVKAQLLADNA